MPSGSRRTRTCCRSWSRTTSTRRSTSPPTANAAANDAPRGQRSLDASCARPTRRPPSRPGSPATTTSSTTAATCSGSKRTPGGVFFFAGKGVKLTDIPDGTSNTAACRASGCGDFSNAIATDRDRPVLTQPEPIPPTPTRPSRPARPSTRTDLANQWRSDYGGYWIQGFHMTLYTHAGLPNTRSCAFPPSTMMMVANSAHTHGAERDAVRRVGPVRRQRRQHRDVAGHRHPGRRRGGRERLPMNRTLGSAARLRRRWLLGGCGGLGACRLRSIPSDAGRQLRRRPGSRGKRASRYESLDATAPRRSYSTSRSGGTVRSS